MTMLRELGEFGLIDRLTRVLPSNDAVVEGIGDDCAVVRVGERQWLVSCDASVEGIHFRRDLLSPDEIGWRAAASALSDIAAMGGIPRFVLVALACPPEMDVAVLDALYEGLADSCAQAEAAIIGGDTTKSPDGLFLDVTVIGEPSVGRVLLRRGAEDGDVLMVTGYPGRSAAGLLALMAGAEAPELVKAHTHPMPRLAEGQWLASQPGVHALIDVSDGLLQDAGHVAKASGLGVEIDACALSEDTVLAQWAGEIGFDPVAVALTGGEAYELVCAVDSAAAGGLGRDFGERFSVPLTGVGRFEAALDGVRTKGQVPGTLGHDHFRGPL